MHRGKLVEALVDRCSYSEPKTSKTRTAMSTEKIVIIGGGPTGLGAATRLADTKHDNWLLIDAEPLGGLSRSFVDDKGFTWDLGGHVIFSHYNYFDNVMDYSTQEWLTHERESWVWLCGKWVPYPFQNNIHRLPNAEKQECLEGLLDVFKETHDAKAQNFQEYFNRQFGPGISRLFMEPYNFKVWAVPPQQMSTEWTGERVATVDLKRVCKNVIHDTDDAGWGPNATFRFPVNGGTGGIWNRLAAKLPQDKLRSGPENFVTKIDAVKKELTLKNGDVVKYDKLLSTMPIDSLLRTVEGPFPADEWRAVADKMVYSATNVVGFGIVGKPPAHLKTMCWMYFPQDDSPFYRATVFSNYSPKNAPEGCWSLMLEVSESVHKPVDQATLIAECLAGCIASNLLTADDEVISKWHHRLAKGYPTPFLGRNALLEQVQPTLLANGIYSRGRFGGWKYEVGNQDHSMMQGVEAVDAMRGLGEEVTYFSPGVVNGAKQMDRTLTLAN
jgi:protoporphyrinogen oxidase